MRSGCAAAAPHSGRSAIRYTLAIGMLVRYVETHQPNGRRPSHSSVGTLVDDHHITFGICSSAARETRKSPLLRPGVTQPGEHQLLRHHDHDDNPGQFIKYRASPWHLKKSSGPIYMEVVVVYWNCVALLFQSTHESPLDVHVLRVYCQCIDDCSLTCNLV